MCGYCWPPLHSGIMTTNQSDRPNILFIMADSAVAGLMGAYGHPVVETPTIYKLVESGIRFDTAYCPFPLCAPARAALMAGRHTLEHRLWDNAAPLSSDHPTFATTWPRTATTPCSAARCTSRP